MNRNDLRDIALLRLKEARVLLRSSNYAGAYYLCGYVIECALKACIAKYTKRYDFPDRKTVNSSYTHDLSTLVKVAGLETHLEVEARGDSIFEANWAVVKDWSENSRYKTYGKREAQDIYSAIASRKYGVLRWIRKHW